MEYYHIFCQQTCISYIRLCPTMPGSKVPLLFMSSHMNFVIVFYIVFCLHKKGIVAFYVIYKSVLPSINTIFGL